jgi:hypothetical protein
MPSESRMLTRPSSDLSIILAISGMEKIMAHKP